VVTLSKHSTCVCDAILVGFLFLFDVFFSSKLRFLLNNFFNAAWLFTTCLTVLIPVKQGCQFCNSTVVDCGNHYRFWVMWLDFSVRAVLFAIFGL